MSDMKNTGNDLERPSMDVDIACVGFGPAMAGFLTVLSKGLVKEDGSFLAESKAMPGMPLQVLCYERADGIGFGVSGAVSKAQSVRATLPDLDLAEIPMATPVKKEINYYLLDPEGPEGPSRRSTALRFGEFFLRKFSKLLRVKDHAFPFPWTPPFFRKKGGFIFSLGQFNNYFGERLMSEGLVQIWPGMPVAEPLTEGATVKGIRLIDQGVDRKGNPSAGYSPGMDIRADLTVVGDGPVGAVGRLLNGRLGLPPGHHQRDWAVGMKFVAELPEDCPWEEGTVIHTLGYPEPEIFGFLYVHPDRVASFGIFVPSWWRCPTRTAYRLLQYWMLHPALWKGLKGGRIRSFGAKSLLESGKPGEPVLAGDGFARIGEGSGSTNLLTSSGVDEAFFTGTLLAEAVLEILKEGKSFSAAELERTYIAKRRQSRLEKEAKIAAKARYGFNRGFIRGLTGMMLAWASRGLLYWPSEPKPTTEEIASLEDYFRNEIFEEELDEFREKAARKGAPLHEFILKHQGWPEIEYDGEMLISHQDALLMGGKVQAPGGYKDHVTFDNEEVCKFCREKTCIEACSGQAITMPPDGGVPLFDREKCLHCGACIWNCSKPAPDEPDRGNLTFSAGAGGLHSAEN